MDSEFRYFPINLLVSGWYRFTGEAGTIMSDISDPPSWEGCGTSRVVWLRGTHPDISQGTVKVEYCMTGVRDSCEVTVTGELRTCLNVTSNTVYHVYYLVRVPADCQWAYCAKTNLPGPS